MVNDVCGSFETQCVKCHKEHKIYFKGYIKDLDSLCVSCNKCNYESVHNSIILDFNKLNIIHIEEGKLVNKTL